MSHIFDALQRSEAERSDAKTTVHATVTELLERAERQALLQREAEDISAEYRDENRASAEREFISDNIPSKDVLEVPLGLVETSMPEFERATIFKKFRALELAPQKHNRLVSIRDRESPAAEAFRLLRVRLRHLRKDRQLKKILITSTSPAEGKSFTAANLACTLASGSQERILLVEGDLRRPVLSKIFGANPQFGIYDYISGKASLTASIYRLESAGIWLLPGGSSGGDPMEIIQSPKFSQAIEQFTAWFDWIILDSPPVLPMADTTALARLADGILLVARRGTTKKRKLVKGVEAFEPNKLLGAVLNSSDSPNEKDYYYYRHTSTASETAENVS
jgi:capsular exopolysaccharide synthesis family protein